MSGLSFFHVAIGNGHNMGFLCYGRVFFVVTENHQVKGFLCHDGASFFTIESHQDRGFNVATKKIVSAGSFYVATKFFACRDRGWS